ncbi:MAG: hydroxyacid dehydrogenase [Firmicutes bacterium]|nr:hydroxyacid dehydrogenase [Bacillota bacterium]
MAVRLLVVADDANRGLLEDLRPLPEGWQGESVRERDAGGLAQRLPEAEAVVARRFPPSMARLASRLRLLVVYGGGADDVAYDLLPPEAVVAAVGGYEASVAEHALGLTFALTQNLPAAERATRRGCRLPGDAGLAPGVELAGRTVGILGFGRVGREVARRLAPFDCDILALKRAPDGYLKEYMGLMELGGPEFLDTLLAASDVLVVTLPLTPATRGLVGQRELARMKPGAFLVNVSRAAVVDEDALFFALTSGHLRGAALDVSYDEEAVDSPTAHRAFDRLGTVILTPRIGAHTDGAMRRQREEVREQLARYARGEALSSVVARP